MYFLVQTQCDDDDACREIMYIYTRLLRDTSFASVCFHLLNKPKLI